jgi:hypothetical protein
MRTAYPQTEKIGATIGLYLAVCICIYGLFAFGFYSLLQPHRFTNPGLSAYEPPSARYKIRAKSTYTEPTATAKAIEETSHRTTNETHQVEGRAAVVRRVWRVKPEWELPAGTKVTAHYAPAARAERTTAE